MESWQYGNLLHLFWESLTIQGNLESVYKAKTIDQISTKFAEEMQKSNINGALKLLIQIICNIEFFSE